MLIGLTRVYDKKNSKKLLHLFLNLVFRKKVFEVTSSTVHHYKRRPLQHNYFIFIPFYHQKNSIKRYSVVKSKIILC